MLYLGTTGNSHIEVKHKSHDQFDKHGRLKMERNWYMSKYWLNVSALLNAHENFQ